MELHASHILTYVIGFTAQLLFSWRMVAQWISSERSKKTEIPKNFWLHSMLASFLLFVYGWLRDDFAIILGQILTYFIYIRNMQLQGDWLKFNKFLRYLLLFFPFVIFFYTFNNNQLDVHRFFKNENIPLWLLILGTLSQLIFTLRFVYQWVYSEKKKTSSLPLGFWLISLIGSVMILAYAIIRRDPVLFIGQLSGFIVYSRNIIIAKKQA